MKDAILTIRLASSLRKRVEDLARREGRSLSQQAGRLIEQGIGERAGPPATTREGERRALSGIFQGGQVPTLADFREARASISRSVAGEKSARAYTRR
jgi:predicted transcriptional regulator